MVEHVEKDYFQEEVVSFLKGELDSTIKCAFPIAGSILDILVEYQSNYFFIDLIGYPGMFKDAFSLERYQTIARSGIYCYPLKYSFWKNENEKAKKDLLHFIKST